MKNLNCSWHFGTQCVPLNYFQVSWLYIYKTWIVLENSFTPNTYHCLSCILASWPFKRPCTLSKQWHRYNRCVNSVERSSVPLKAFGLHGDVHTVCVLGKNVFPSPLVRQRSHPHWWCDNIHTVALSASSENPPHLTAENFWLGPIQRKHRSRCIQKQDNPLRDIPALWQTRTVKTKGYLTSDSNIALKAQTTKQALKATQPYPMTITYSTVVLLLPRLVTCSVRVWLYSQFTESVVHR